MAIGRGTTGSSAATTATGTSSRSQPPSDSAACSAVARTTAISGIIASANRVGSALSTTGRSDSSLYSAVCPVGCRSTTTCGPSDSQPMTTAAAAAASAPGLRRTHTSAPTSASTSGRPKNAVYSAAELASRALDGSPPSDSGDRAVNDARSA